MLEGVVGGVGGGGGGGAAVITPLWPRGCVSVGDGGEAAAAGQRSSER